MNAILSFIPRLFSLRAVILVLAVVFALMGDQLALVGWADRALFSIFGVPDGSDPSTSVPQEAFGPAIADRGLSEPLWSDMAVTAGLAIAALYLVLAIPAMGAAGSLPVTLLLGGCWRRGSSARVSHFSLSLSPSLCAVSISPLVARPLQSWSRSNRQGLRDF